MSKQVDGQEKKVSLSFSCEVSRWNVYLERARKKKVSLSFVIRTLLDMWYSGLELDIKG